MNDRVNDLNHRPFFGPMVHWIAGVYSRRKARAAARRARACIETGIARAAARRACRRLGHDWHLAYGHNDAGSGREVNEVRLTCLRCGALRRVA